jgi:hypothetical protein
MVRVGASTIDDEWQDESLGRSQAGKGLSIANLAWKMGADFQHLGKNQRGRPGAASRDGRFCVGCVALASS